jgi:sialic acid synthase SpsE
MNQGFTINNETYNAQKVLIIAELGTSHGADPVKARELIDAAAESGADCIKFQILYADEILHPNTGEVALPGGNIRLYDRFKQLEVKIDFFADLKAYVESKQLLFLCTPFGMRSVRELQTLKPLAIKIASPELNYTDLLREVANYHLPVFLSTGVSKLGDIEEALEILAPNPVCLFHCVTSYPAPVSDYNLQLLQSLAGVFGLPVGVSDHSLDPELIPALGTAMGAVAIEKHFCLCRTDSGLDDPIALPPADFARMVRAIRRASQEGALSTIEGIAHDQGVELVQAILGDGVKRLSPSEAAYYGRTNRSLHALQDIQEGDTITEDMVGVLRTEKLLRPGLHPSWKAKIIGRQAQAFIPAGEGIRIEDILKG